MRKTFRYLLGAFGIAWILQIIAGILFRKGNNTAYSLLLALSMFAPFIATLISKEDMKKIGWKLHIKKNIGWMLGAWFLPAVLGSIGAILYFLLVPDALDTSFEYIRTGLGTEGLKQLETSGLSVKLYAVISIFSAVTYAPLINMLLAFGEEVGWRGMLYPQLKKDYGMIGGRILGGMIWGIWHWPIMLLAGYEYGTSYWGAPVTGLLLFCLITIAMGILLDFFYEKTSCIWTPSLCHGAINAFAGVPMLFLNPSYSDKFIIGPLMVGVVGGLPLILCAVGICFCDRDKREQATLK